MDSDVFRQIMVASIYPGLTEQVQRLLVEFLQGIGEVRIFMTDFHCLQSASLRRYLSWKTK